MFPFVVADIGGTNARFALVTKNNQLEDGTRNLDFENVLVLQGAEYPKFEDALGAYLETLDGVQPVAACVAIAGPIVGDRVDMTNLPWSFSQKEVCTAFSLNQFEAINDYTALAIATSQIHASGLESVVQGRREPEGNKAIFGPGSGLGVAGLVRSHSRWIPVTSEGGHVNLPVSSPFEIELLTNMEKKFGHVSAEMCLSGPGLENLYHAICAVRGKPADKLSAADISSFAVENRDAECHQALTTFCDLLGAHAGNLVLTYGAKGGAYITGGIVPRFVDFLKASEFEKRFRSKGVMSKYVETVPVDVVVYDKPAFIGAAEWLLQGA